MSLDIVEKSNELWLKFRRQINNDTIHLYQCDTCMILLTRPPISRVEILPVTISEQ